MCQQYATRILLCAVLLLPLIGWSYSQSKTDELRLALSKVLDELENIFEKEIAAKKSIVEIYEGADSKRWGPLAAHARRQFEETKKKRAEILEEWRKRVKEYTDLELPALAQQVRGLPSLAERMVKLARQSAERARNFVQRASKPTSASRGSDLKFKIPGLGTTKRTAGNPSSPSLDPEELRQAYSARIDELDKKHEELIQILEEVQEAQTDKWEKRTAGDAVTMAKFARRQDISGLKLKLDRANSLNALNTVKVGLNWQETAIQNKIDKAKNQLNKVKRPDEQ